MRPKQQIQINIQVNEHINTNNGHDLLTDRYFAHSRFDSKFMRFYAFFMRVISLTTSKMLPGIASCHNIIILNRL